MFCLKGYNQMLKKWIEMKILDDGTVLADDWEHIEEGSIKRYTEQMDMGKKMLWEDDQIVDMQTGKCMIIRFGEYETYCVEEEQVMKSVLNDTQNKWIWKRKCYGRTYRNSVRRSKQNNGHTEKN